MSSRGKSPSDAKSDQRVGAKASSKATSKPKTTRKTAIRKPRTPRAATPVAEASATPAPRALFVAAIEVRWRDLDAFNHVNNSNFLTYLEEARLQWLKHVPGTWFDAHSMPVLAASTINYKLPIEWPASIHVQLGCQRLGASSMTISHRIVAAEDGSRLYSDGEVVMVWMDPATGTPVPLPQAIRDAVASACACA